MKDRVLTFCMVVAMVLLLVGCSQYKKNEVMSDNPLSKVTKETEVYKDEDGSNILNVSFDKVELTSDKMQFVNDKLNKYYEEYRTRIEEVVLPTAKANYQYVDVEVDAPYESTCINEIKRLDKKFFSIVFDEREYLGGAHGGNIINTFNFDLITGEQLSLNDLFIVPADEYKKVLVEQIQEEIDRMKTDEEAYIYDDYKEIVEETIDNVEFYITDDKLVIVYQEYDIAPFSEGVQEVKLDFSNLIGILRSDLQ